MTRNHDAFSISLIFIYLCATYFILSQTHSLDLHVSDSPQIKFVTPKTGIENLNLPTKFYTSAINHAFHNPPPFLHTGLSI